MGNVRKNTDETGRDIIADQIDHKTNRIFG